MSPKNSAGKLVSILSNVLLNMYVLVNGYYLCDLLYAAHLIYYSLLYIFIFTIVVSE